MHLFVISDDVTQDHDPVLHIQKLISKHLEESNCIIKCMNSQMYVQDSTRASAVMVAYLAPWQLLDTQSSNSHGKGEQDAAGTHVKQKATSAVLSRKVTLSNTKDLCSFLKENFYMYEPAVSSFPARQKSVQLKRHVLFYLTSTGELSVACNREGGRFCNVKGIQQLHTVESSGERDLVTAMVALSRILTAV